MDDKNTQQSVAAIDLVCDKCNGHVSGPNRANRPKCTCSPERRATDTEAAESKLTK